MASFLSTQMRGRGLTACRLLAARFSTNTGTKEHIDGLVKGKKVVVFMKGTPDAPRCGFSNGVMQILNFHGVKQFEAHDVLQDESLRQGINKRIMQYVKINNVDIRNALINAVGLRGILR